MKSVTISSTSDAAAINAANSDRDTGSAFDSGFQRRICTVAGQNPMMLDVQSGGLRSDFPENGSFVSDGDEVSPVSGKRVCHVDASGQDMHPPGSLSTGDTSFKLPVSVVGLSDGEATPLISQEETPVLKESPDAGYVEKSLLTDAATSEGRMAISQFEGIRMQQGVPDFSSDSGAKPKATSATFRRKKKKAGNMAGSSSVDSVKGIATSPMHSVGASVQDETERKKAAMSKSGKSLSIPQKILTPKNLLEANSKELRDFYCEVMDFGKEVKRWQWDRVNSIIRNLKEFISRIENLIETYELLTRSYSASSIDKRQSGKIEARRVVGNVIFPYENRANLTLFLGCNVVRYVMSMVNIFILQHKQDEDHHAILLEYLLKIACIRFNLVIDSKINDQLARGEGMHADEMTSSSIDTTYKEPRCSEPRCSDDTISSVFYMALSFLFGGEIFYLRYRTDEHHKKPEYLETCSQLLAKLLQKYRSYHSSRSYMPHPVSDNPMENYLNHLNQLIFFEHVQNWDFVLETLRRLTARLPFSEVDVHVEDKPADIPGQQEKGNQKVSVEELEKSGCILQMRDVIIKEFAHRCCQNCKELHFYAPYEYLAMGLDAGHRSFNYFGQKCANSLSSQVCDLNFESLRDLLTQFKYWAECMMDYDIVMTSEHVVAPSYLRAKERLEENVQQFDKIHQDNLEFLARQLQAEVANLAPKMAKRKSIKIHQRDSAGSLAEEGPPDVVREVIPSDTVSKDNETVSDIATVESIEREEIFLDEEGEWQQVKLGRRWIPVKTALKKLSEALLCHDLSDAVALLKSTNLNDAYQQLQNYLAEQDTLSIDVLMPLISGYLQVREMNRHVLCCEGLFPETQPFVTSLMDNNQLTSREIKEQFVAAMEKINPADIAAQQAFGNISIQISTLLDVQARATTLSDIAIMTSLDILVTSAQLAQERLDHFRNIVINAWKRRYRLLMQHYPQRIRAAKTDKKANDPMAVMLTNDQAFKRYKSAFEKHQVVYQQKRTVVLGMEQSSSDSLRWLQAQVVPMDFPARLAAWNLSLEEVPSITTLGHRIDFIDNHIPDDDALRVDMLARVAHRLDIELSVYSFSSNEVRKLARTQDKPQTAQRPPLSNFFTQPFVSNDSERISAIRGYFHAKIPSVLADFNSSETGMPVVLTGSMAFQHHISSLWDNTLDSPLQHLYRQTAQHLPRGITLQCMRASMTPRDTDLVVLNHSQVDSILEKLKTALEQIRQEHHELSSEPSEVIIGASMDITESSGKVITTGRVIVMDATGQGSTGQGHGDIHYVIDVAKGTYPDQPSPEHYTTWPLKDSHIHIRRIDDIILDEVNIINPTSTGVDGNRRQKAITRLFMIAFLECQQPKLDSVSRMALLHALSSLPGEDPVITALTEQLRQRPFYIVCHEGRCQGARRTAPEQP